MALEGEVEAAEPVPREGVRPALQHNGAGLVQLHHPGYHRHKQACAAKISLGASYPIVRIFFIKCCATSGT